MVKHKGYQNLWRARHFFVPPKSHTSCLPRSSIDAASSPPVAGPPPQQRRTTRLEQVVLLLTRKFWDLQSYSMTNLPLIISAEFGYYAC
ncbi:hypothetical protein Hanom_Chr07g00660451 [Helianthus anomalus]